MQAVIEVEQFNEFCRRFRMLSQSQFDRLELRANFIIQSSTLQGDVIDETIRKSMSEIAQKLKKDNIKRHGNPNFQTVIAGFTSMRNNFIGTKGSLSLTASDVALSLLSSRAKSSRLCSPSRKSSTNFSALPLQR